MSEQHSEIDIALQMLGHKDKHIAELEARIKDMEDYLKSRKVSFGKRCTATHWDNFCAIQAESRGAKRQ